MATYREQKNAIISENGYITASIIIFTISYSGIVNVGDKKETRSSSQPRWEYAYIELFINYYNDSNVSGQDKLALLYATNLYVKEGQRTGRGTFLDGININRKEYSNLLIAGV